MEAWQQDYLDNTARILSLSKLPQAQSPQALRRTVERFQAETEALVEENTALIRRYLFPRLETVTRADDQAIASLRQFADRLAGPGKPDNNLALHIHEGLLTAARFRHDRDFLIRELYECGLRSFYFLDNSMAGVAPDKFQRKIRLYFREGASYLRIYSQISSVETRGYIHRCMGNIALSYGKGSPLQKLEAINASLKVLTDPAYHALTPQLPWERFINSTHQERTTLLAFLRDGDATPQIVRQVMESAQIVRNQQLERVKKEGHPLEARWEYVYAAAMFFSGITDIRAFLEKLIAVSGTADPEDFSSNGLFANASVVSFFMEALRTYGASVREEYAPHADRMLRRAVDYLTRAIRRPECSDVYAQVEKIIQGFGEFPGGMKLTELFHRLVPVVNRDLYLHSAACGKLCRFLAELARQQAPELLAELPVRGEALLDLAEDAGLLHDIGLTIYPRCYLAPVRHRLKDEEELFQHHTVFGWKMLNLHESASRCAWAALGSHSREGYPAQYRREDDPTPTLTELVGISDFLTHCLVGELPRLTLEQRFEVISQNPGGRFRPELADLVCRHREQVTAALERISREVYQTLWEGFCR